MFKNLNSSTLLTTSNLHHAYLVTGSRESGQESVCRLLESQGLKLVGSPDFFSWTEEVFGVDEARDLSTRAIRKAFTPRLPSGQAGKKIFFLAPERITREAQNALLKTFEEPIPDTHFFLFANEEVVIPTLRSRMQVVHMEQLGVVSEANKFLDMGITARLNFAKNFDGDLSSFLDQLLLTKRDNTVYQMRLISSSPSASSRLILEHLALVLP